MRLLWLASALLVSALFASVGARAAGAPAVKWAVSGGGAGIDDADGVGTDADGRIVISGGFEGAHADVFATAYGKRGRLLWTRRYGGPGADQAFDNDVDPRGDAVITGSFNDTVDFGGPVLVSRGANLPRYGDAFLLKLGRGGRTKWVRQIGGTGSDGGDEVAIGPHRNVYVIGDANGPVTFTPSTTLPPTGGRDAWAARYRPDGGLVWARSLGGTGEQQSHGISGDYDGKALVTGEFQGTSQFGPVRLDSDGTQQDVFIAKLDRLGRVRWAKRFGNGDFEMAAASTPTGAGASTSPVSSRARSSWARRRSPAPEGTTCSSRRPPAPAASCGPSPWAARAGRPAPRWRPIPTAAAI